MCCASCAKRSRTGLPYRGHDYAGKRWRNVDLKLLGWREREMYAMSELAFNSNGENFEIPAVVTGWRVRRLKPRGAPELVYGRDGRPLTIPIESHMTDLREAVSGTLD